MARVNTRSVQEGGRSQELFGMCQHSVSPNCPHTHTPGAAPYAHHIHVPQHIHRYIWAPCARASIWLSRNSWERLPSFTSQLFPRATLHCNMMRKVPARCPHSCLVTLVSSYIYTHMYDQGDTRMTSHARASRETRHALASHEACPCAQHRQTLAGDLEGTGGKCSAPTR